MSARCGNCTNFNLPALTTAGLQRADLLVHTLRGVKFTHVFSSHTTRSRQAVEKIAATHSLPVVQLPAPGSLFDGKPVTDQTTRLRRRIPS
jgi:broad specificity phosphatase PhoE